MRAVWQRDVRIALTGPLVNLGFAVLAAGVISATVPGAKLWEWPFLQPSNLPRSLVWANLYLAGLNLLPAYPLDGGRVLRAYFARSMDAAAATRRAVSISHAIAMVLMVAGLFSNAWLTIVGIIIFSAAQLEERAVIFQSVLDNVRLEEVMLTDFATLSPADTLEDALEKAVHSLQDDFPVVRGSDMVGVISRQRILEALRMEGNGYVQAVMNKIFEVSVRQESLATAFRKLTSRNLSIIPVVEDQRLVGIVTLQNLMHSMALLAESKKLRRDGIELENPNPDSKTACTGPSPAARAGISSSFLSTSSGTGPSTWTTAMASRGSDDASALRRPSEKSAMLISPSPRIVPTLPITPGTSRLRR